MSITIEDMKERIRRTFVAMHEIDPYEICRVT